MELLSKFENDLALRRRSPRTIRSYKNNVKEFLDYNPEPMSVSYEDLEFYLAHLIERDLKTSTLKSNFSAISSFYEFLIYKEVAHRNPVTGFRKRYLDAPNESERRQVLMIHECRQFIADLDFIREVAIVMVLAKTGIRRSELLGLRPSDIDLTRNIIIIERKKRAKNRIRFIDPELHDVLTKYLDWRNARQRIGRCKTEYLWISDIGGRVHKDYINRFIQTYAEPLGLHDPTGPLETRLTCHCFRGFLVTHLRRAGMKKEHIQTLLGHSIKNEVWSGHYLQIDMELVREEYLKCVPKLL
ncbi:tyrosine-type recombinase/integrase [Methanolobus sp. ZRKC4]|uniref:tyrosine-type recombinase/integrase n=1 Tax=Methanolobus sp. ZRKC4 TaxID=3125787 RepID=UPI0032436E19